MKRMQFRLRTILLVTSVIAIVLGAVVYRSAFVETAGEQFLRSRDGWYLRESFEREIHAGMPLRTVQALIGWGYELPTNERDEFLRLFRTASNSTYVPQAGDRVFVYTTNMSRGCWIIYRDDRMLNYDDILQDLRTWNLRGPVVPTR